MFNWMKNILFKNNDVKALSFNTMNPIIYLMNDPSMPKFWKHMPVQPQESPSYNVKNYKGGGYSLKTAEGKAAQVFTVITETLKWVNRHAPHKLNNWACGTTLSVNPTAGKKLNAFYNRKSVKFFYYNELYTAMSSDVIAHELGHAIFDSYRPDTWNTTFLELWSFHEAFADMTSIITSLQNKEVIDLLLKNGKLEKDNFVSRIAEQVGKTIYEITKGKDGRSPFFLRNAAEDFDYVDPSNLSKKGTYATISAQCHSFGRIMLSALYSIFIEFYLYNLKKGLKGNHAIEVARNLISKYMLKAITIVPKTPKFYLAFARSLMWAAKQENVEHFKLIQNIFRKRDIVPRPSFKMLSTYDDILCAQGTVVDDGIIKTNSNETVKLSEELGIGALSYNPLYELDVDISTENIYFVDDENVVDAEVVDRKETIKSAKFCLDLLHKTNSVGDDEDTPFEIQNNKLVRTYID